MMGRFLRLGSISSTSNSNWYPESFSNGVIFRFLTHSSQAPSPPTLASHQQEEDSLFRRIAPFGHPSSSILPAIDQWLREGRSLDPNHLRTTVKLLRKYKRYSHALQLSDWMGQRGYVSPGEVATKLDLIARVRGLEDAEKYFSSIPNNLKTFKVYGALLNCYAHLKLLDKAESVLQKMRGLGYNLSLSYNVMLSLYLKLRKHDKFVSLLQEMEQKDIHYGKPTLYIMLNEFASARNIDGMEKLLQKMEGDLLITMDWHMYVVAAKGYLRVIQTDKASEMLKKAEELMRGRRIGFELLLSMYASLSNKSEVYRIWNLYKKKCKMCNTAYSYMISSLVKLNDIEGAEKILKEWESVNKHYDFGVPNILINAYTKKDMLIKAEEFVSRAIENGKKPPPSTWDLLALGYFKDNQMDKAVEAMKKAMLAVPGTWKLNHTTLSACLKYLEKKGDEKLVEEFKSLLQERGYLTKIQINSSKCSENEKSGSDDFEEMESDKESDSRLSKV